MNIQDRTTDFLPEDIEKNKALAGLAYLLFFLPLIACPGSSFGKFHASQSLLLWLIGVAGGFILRFLPFIGGTLATILGFLIFGCTIYCLVTTFNGRAKELPYIGNVMIFK